MPNLPRWVLITLIFLVSIFVAQASYRTYLDVQRQAQDQWLRQEVLRAQSEQNQTLLAIRAQVEQSLSTMDATWQRLIATQRLVEQTEQKVDETQQKIDATRQEVKGLKGNSEGGGENPAQR